MRLLAPRPALPHQLDVCGAGKSREVGILGDSDASFIETFRRSLTAAAALPARILNSLLAYYLAVTQFSSSLPSHASDNLTPSKSNMWPPIFPNDIWN